MESKPVSDTTDRLPRSDNGSGNAGAPSVLVAYGQDDADRLRTSGLPGRYVQL